ncbi:hypothetical protein D3C81_1805610 [compost metagenome]
MSRAPSGVPSCLSASAACSEPLAMTQAQAKAREVSFSEDMDGTPVVPDIGASAAEPRRTGAPWRQQRAITARARICSVVVAPWADKGARGPERPRMKRLRRVVAPVCTATVRSNRCRFPTH